ncbi:MAG: RDD family protein, partial [Euryarchaeota archaeon]|nr:RDD family protein [Euryarchaeota archaeon]
SSGATIGKRFMDLKVKSLRGNMSYTKAFVRSFTKAWLPVFTALFLLDLIVGFLTQGDPKQRFSDVVADTAVVHTRA